jgi:hypothetical protein
MTGHISAEGAVYIGDITELSVKHKSGTKTGTTVRPKLADSAASV